MRSISDFSQATTFPATPPLLSLTKRHHGKLGEEGGCQISNLPLKGCLIAITIHALRLAHPIFFLSHFSIDLNGTACLQGAEDNQWT